MTALTQLFTRLCTRYLPDALGFCLLLTFVVYFLALICTGHSSLTLLQYWGDSLWNLNAFAFQMITVLVTGHMLACAPVVQKWLNKLAELPKTTGSALVYLMLLSLGAAWINWGFGLIVSALLAIRLARRFPNSSVGVFLATGYAGFVVWHGGLSGSIPLSIAGQDKVLAALNLPPVALSETLFSPLNLTILIALSATLPLLAFSLRNVPAQGVLSDFAIAPETARSPGQFWRDRFEHSRWPLFIFGVFAGIYLVNKLMQKLSPDINDINLIFFTLNCFLLKNIATLLSALAEAAKSVGGIIIQYPLYAGLMGLMQQSGLGDQLSMQFVTWSSVELFPLMSFLSAGLLNFFIPSGGGQWVVQGPILVKAGIELGIPVQKTAMAIAWGDAWTNLVQPFWALPLLSMAKLELKDIMGICVGYLLLSGLIISLAFMCF